jgi:SAM-dependent methyltransferase
MLLAPIDAQHLEVFESHVVPRFLSLLSSVVLDMLLPCEGATIANLGCRSGFPDADLSRALSSCNIFGCDPSEAAIELAKTKAASLHNTYTEYVAANHPPFPLTSSSFSHVICIYPMVAPAHFRDLVLEASRLVAPGGQVLFAMPLRGSFLEIVDLLKEYALKHDDPIGHAVDACQAARPTIESLAKLFEVHGLDDTDVAMRQLTVPFESGSAFLADPVAQLMVMPDFQIHLGPNNIDKAMDYVKEAIGLYWSELRFDLSLNIGCASARGV